MLIIAGHHRSGTSLLAQLLAAAGLFLGDELMPGAASNPHGHFEDMEVVRLHDRLLADNGRTWQVVDDLLPVVNDDIWQAMHDLVDRRRQHHELWGFKDPRVCLFLPLWRHVVPEARILVTIRHPSACVDSIERREARNLVDGILPPEQCTPFWTEQDHAVRLWASHNRGLIRAADAYGDDVMVTAFGDLAGNQDIVGSVNRRWGLDLQTIRPNEVFDADVVTAVESPVAVGSPALGAEVEDLWRRLQDRALADADRSAAGLTALG